MSKKITVVIPCYNQGHYLEDALKSLEACDNNLFDLIIVNDGSTDSSTNTILNELSGKGFNVVYQENKGLGEARNAGIRLAKTDYILPLDSDNKLLPGYMLRAMEIMEARPDVAVVYGNSSLFGDKKGILKPGPFNLQRLMLGNFIDACAVIRKSVLDKIGMYDNMKIMGYEDWDLWLRIAFEGHKFYYFDEVLFEYRVRENSMMKGVNQDIEKQNEIEDYFSKKYSDKLDFEFAFTLFFYQLKKKPLAMLRYLFIRKFFPAYFQKLIKDNRIRKNFIYA